MSTTMYFPESWVGKPLLTVEEVATALEMHVDDVYRHAKAGVIPSFKLGGRRRFRTAEIVSWLMGDATGA